MLKFPEQTESFSKNSKILRTFNGNLLYFLSTYVFYFTKNKSINCKIELVLIICETRNLFFRIRKKIFLIYKKYVFIQML